MDVIIVGLSHKTAPVEVREKLAIPESRLTEALRRLSGYPGIRESMVLSTCNRVEVYAVVDEVQQGWARVQRFLADTHLSLSPEQLMPHLYWYNGARAIQHLFRVGASLDSMILGEPQVLAQLKTAYDAALGSKSSGLVLNKLVKKAISVAKRVRTETKIAQAAVSVSSAAVELAKKIFSHLNEKTVLLIGAGGMAKLAARHLMNQGVRRMLITTRDLQSAAQLAKDFNGDAVPFEEFHAHMAVADIVLCSTGASHYLIRADDVHRTLRQRMNHPIFLIDISVPRNIDPAVKDIDNAFLFDIDDLEMHINQNREERRCEASKAEQMVQEEVQSILSWMKTLQVTPTILALRRRAEDIKQMELQKTWSRLRSLSPQERAAVESLASGVVNKLLHGPLVALKAEADTSVGCLYVEAARRFFGLDESALTGDSRSDAIEGGVPTDGHASGPERLPERAPATSALSTQSEAHPQADRDDG